MDFSLSITPSRLASLILLLLVTTKIAIAITMLIFGEPTPLALSGLVAYFMLLVFYAFAAYFKHPEYCLTDDD